MHLLNLLARLRFNVTDYIYEIRTNIRNVFRGLKNFWTFRREIYRWRWWDFTFFYDLYIKCLREAVKKKETRSHHFDAQDQINDMWRVIQHYETFKDPPMRLYKKGYDAVSEWEDRHWNAMHDIMKRHGREWWD